ncbi:MAG: hypothetical protein IT369_22360 [Candidatus Latescibacteria bacterium]|nr:hypothetical protein [Candidatus Latescibacterota bacterium]
MSRTPACCRPTAPLLIVLLLSLPLGTWQCAARLKAAAAGALMGDMVAAIDQQDDIDLVAQAAPGYLLLLEGLRQGDPHNRRLLESLAQGYASYATLVEIDDPARAGQLFRRAKDCGLLALHQRPRLAPLLAAPFGEFSRIRTVLQPQDLAPVFWTALSWGAWISTHADSMAALAELPKVILLMEWVVAQDEGYLHASPHVFLGVYHAAIPAALGGRPDLALYHFDRALALTQGKALMVPVQKARYYARQVFDRQLYTDLLQQALDQPADSDPDLTLQNMAARRLARRLLEETDAFF